MVLMELIFDSKLSKDPWMLLGKMQRDLDFFESQVESKSNLKMF